MNLPFRSINPYTKQLLQEYEFLSAQSLEDKIGQCWNGYQTYRRTTLAERQKRILNVKQILLDNQYEYAQLISQEVGKPIGSALGEIKKSAGHCQYYADHCHQFLQNRKVDTEASHCYIRNDPLGPILQIMPWNFPFWLSLRSGVPALLAGNTVLLKGAPNTPQCSLAIEQLFHKAGFKEDEYINLFASTEHTELMISHPQIRGLAFTGSSAAGKHLASLCGKHMKKMTCELGGSDPFIVLKDAPLEKALDDAVLSRMTNNGQACINAKRFIIHEDIYMQFRAGLAKRLQQIKMGDPSDDSTTLGPIARDDLLANLQRQCRQAIEQGAELIYGNKQQIYEETLHNNLFSPMVMQSIDRQNIAYREEFFGPVFILHKISFIEEAIALANDSQYGLMGAIYSEDVSRAEQMAAHLEVGTVFINEWAKSDSRLPVGGIKDSGVGRECAQEGILEFTNIKPVWVNNTF